MGKVISLKPKAMSHQLVSLKHDKKTDMVFDVSDPGCVSADTEFLTPTGWKRIDQYIKGDMVAQFHPMSREIEFVEPIAYVRRPCRKMIAIAPARGTSQRLSHEHRVLYYDEKGNHGVCSAAEYMADLHQKGPNHLKRKFATTFSVRGTAGIELSDENIRLMVAVIADGHFQNDGNRCVVRLKKQRKIDRLVLLLSAAGIEASIRRCGGDPDFRVFTFTAPRHDKEFNAYWWCASQAQLEVIADELPHWDSSIDLRESGGVRFSTFVEESADFAQYAFAAAKHPASKAFTFRDRTAEDRGLMVEFCVHAQLEDKFVGPGRKDSVYEIANPEGFKYCFEVPTTFLLLRHRGYIFATGNTGKTFVRIMAFAERRRKGSGRALVLACRSLLKTVWFDDFKKFAPDMKVSVARADNRDAAFREDADVYVTNHDGIKWLMKQKPAFFAKFSELIIDESTAFKHHTSQRSRAMAKVAHMEIMKKPVFRRRALMTGTPNSNSITDVWHQAYILDKGKRLGPSFYAFRNSVSEPEQVGRSRNAIKWHDKEGAEEAVFDLLSDITIRHKFEDCVDIPQNFIRTVEFEMPPAQAKAYTQLEETQLLWLFGDRPTRVKNRLTGTTDRPTLTAVNAGAVTTKLLQIASGAVYDNDGKYHWVDNSRYELVMDLVEERKHPIVAFLWRHQRDHLVQEAEKRGMNFAVLDGNTSDKDRDMMVAAYQAGVYDVFFGHPQSMAHGLTMTRGSSIIWPSPTANLEWFKQMNKRQHRIGQKHKTEVITVLAKNTHDVRVYNDILMAKDARMANLLDLFASLKSNYDLKKAA